MSVFFSLLPSFASCPRLGLAWLGLPVLCTGFLLLGRGASVGEGDVGEEIERENGRKKEGRERERERKLSHIFLWVLRAPVAGA